MKLLGMVVSLVLLVFVAHSLVGSLSGGVGSGLSQFVRSGLTGICADAGAVADASAPDGTGIPASGSPASPATIALPDGAPSPGLALVSQAAGGNGRNLPCPTTTTAANASPTP